ncbi:MAG TPA: T9SS type A sorting domain-containing protein [Candidatus Krumholzibacteria bacterium]|nr:T9SS type A sorting domain-containing protein [Candidatus Krumholzibacteria bacterium]
MITSDGAGGAIVCWADGRDGGADLYAQRITSAGLTLWTADGVAVCTAPGFRFDMETVSDGVGGAIGVWIDERAGAEADDIYAQRVSANGIVLWAADGVPICAVPGEQHGPVIMGDGEGGAIIAWGDGRNGTSSTDIYAQRVDASGGPVWDAGGIALCASPSWQTEPAIASDGIGGAIVVWEDGRAGYEDADLYAQRINGLGEALWVPNGVPVCEHRTSQSATSMVPDGSGGAIMAWVDYFGIQWEQSNLYVQHIGAGGEILWDERGVGLSVTVFQDPNDVVLTPDGAGGAIAAWRGSSGSSTGTDIYAQRIDPMGNTLWTTNGVSLCDEPGEQHHPAIAFDGAGGAIVAWRDDAPGLNNADIRAGRIDPLGVVLWGNQGAPVSTAVNDQLFPAIVSDGGGGVVVTWTDGRNKAVSGYDVYAQRIGPEGMVPTAVGRQSQTPGLVVSPNVPNPFTTSTSVDLHLDDESVVEIRVYDVRGRLVRRAPHGTLHAGSHRLQFDGRDDAGEFLPSGVYFFRVTANGNSTARKIVIAR